ncbi:hypothetical protein ACJMK2_022775 [Sinanodonta woodiana]|uniref:Uncharacterized protein n=1 Tax=Sinanodonta woodiana TaxID=1069815 RepID=A0ABD3TLG7_SINWO
MTAKRKQLPDVQTTADSSNHRDDLSKEMSMIGINENKLKNSSGENDAKMVKKGTIDACSKDADISPDPYDDYIHDESNINDINERVVNSTAQNDGEDSTSCHYAVVVKVGRRSQNITGTIQSPITNTYDTTYTHQVKKYETGDDYQHIYDHVNSKNPA